VQGDRLARVYLPECGSLDAQGHAG
jgi:hypothetical protein